MPTVEECSNRRNEIGIQSICDDVISDYCKVNPDNLDLCGCSSNAFQKIPDPQMGKLNPKCWAESCSTNTRAYRFAFNNETCPTVCIDNSTITSLGSNITDSSFKQYSCNNTVSGSSNTSITNNESTSNNEYNTNPQNETPIDSQITQLQSNNIPIQIIIAIVITIIVLICSSSSCFVF